MNILNIDNNYRQVAEQLSSEMTNIWSAQWINSTYYNKGGDLSDIDCSIAILAHVATLFDEVRNDGKSNHIYKRDIYARYLELVELYNIKLEQLRSSTLEPYNQRKLFQNRRFVPLCSISELELFFSNNKVYAQVAKLVLQRTIEKTSPGVYFLGKFLIDLLNIIGLNITDIYIIDGTYFNVNSSLNQIYKGKRFHSKKEPKAGQVGLQHSLSLNINNSQDFAITSGIVNERLFLNDIMKSNVLFIADAGYIDYNNISTASGYIIVHGRSSTAGEIQSVEGNISPELKQYILGNSVSFLEEIEELNSSLLDLQVLFNKKILMRVVRLAKNNHIDLFLTNLPQSISATIVVCTYKARWQCELFYKGIKSGSALKPPNTKQEHFIIANTYCALTANYIKRSICGRLGELTGLCFSFDKIARSHSFLNANFLMFNLGSELFNIDCANNIRTFLATKERFLIDHQSVSKHENLQTFLSNIVRIAIETKQLCLLDTQSEQVDAVCMQLHQIYKDEFWKVLNIFDPSKSLFKNKDFGTK